MNSDSLGLIYEKHHHEKNREGFSLFKNIRGPFLREAIGTGKRVLDIGCRDGTLTRTYAEGNQVTGMDIDEHALAAFSTIPGTKTVLKDINGEWGFPAHSFDAVVAAEVLEHLYYPDAVVQKIAHVLTDEGVLVGSVPNAFNLKNRLRFLLGRKEYTPLADPTHINHFSYRELEQILRNHFKEVHIYPLGTYAALDSLRPGWFAFMFLFVARKPKLEYYK